MYAVQCNESIRVYDCYQYRESIKEIEGRFYDADEKCWIIPLTAHNASTLSLLGASLDESLKELAKSARVAFLSRCEHRKPRVKAKLFAHQQDAYDFALDAFEKGKAVALLADMGTGKSMMTIAITGTLEADKGVKKMLVVCPKSIVGVWEDEFRKFADYRYALTVLDGTMEKKRSAFNYMQGAALQIIVVNYESCWRLETEITKWKPDLIVCDESSKIKTPSASQSKALHRLGRLSNYNIILTGTPITGSPLDIFSQYKFLDDSIFGIDVAETEIWLDPYETKTIAIDYTSEVAYPYAKLSNALVQIVSFDSGVNSCTCVIKNNSGTVQSATITVSGNAININTRTVTVRDEKSIEVYGVVDYSHPTSELVQSYEQAEHMATLLLTRMRAGEGSITTEWRGNPELETGLTYDCIDRFGDSAKLLCEYNKFTYDGGLKQETRGRKK